MMSINSVILVLALVVTSATAIHQKKDGDLCNIGTIQGVWTDVSKCPAASEYVQVTQMSPQPAVAVVDFEVLVCCERQNIQRECLTSHVYYEFSLVDLPRGGSHSYILVEEKCNLYAKLEGDWCSLNGVTGNWTFTAKYCAKFDEPSITEETGCCRTLPDMISTYRCQQVEKMVGDKCDHNVRSPYLVELYDENQVTENYCSGILISAQYVLTNAYNLFWYNPRFALIGTKGSTQLIAVEKELINPAFNPGNWHLHNVALILLNETVTFTANVYPACLPRQRAMDTLNFRMVGYEFSASEPIINNVLILNKSECNSRWPSISGTHLLCVTRTEVEPCRIKYGAGLIAVAQSSSCVPTVFAVLSNIDNKNCTDYVLTNVFTHLAWIEATISST